MTLRVTAIAAGALAAAAFAPAAANAACPIDEPVVFAGLDYGSAAFHTALARQILEKGYECETDAIPGTTLVLAQGLARGDVDIMMEIWTANPAQAFVDGEKAGTTTRLGTTFPDAVEGWYVPRYVVEGENAPAPDLKSVTDAINQGAIYKFLTKPWDDAQLRTTVAQAFQHYSLAKEKDSSATAPGAQP